MSTLAEIEAAVDQLPLAQQEELYALVSALLAALPKGGLSPEELEAWRERARNLDGSEENDVAEQGNERQP